MGRSGYEKRTYNPPCQAPNPLTLSACTLVIRKRFSRSARLAERDASWAWRCDCSSIVSCFLCLCSGFGDEVERGGVGNERRGGVAEMEREEEWREKRRWRTSCRGLILLGAVLRRGAEGLGIRDVIFVFCLLTLWWCVRRVRDFGFRNVGLRL
jgi:hypothetical protein